MAAAERAVTEIVFDAGPAEDGARRVERAGKAIIDTNRSVSTAAGKAADDQVRAQERSARATEMAAAAMRAAQSAIQTTASVASAAAQSTMALARSHEAISAAIAIARRDYVGLATNAAELSEKQSAAAASTNALARALTALGLAIGVQQYINFVDSMSLLNARIGLVTKSTNEYLTAQRAVYTIAQGAAQPIEDLGNLYTKVAEALTPLGKGQGEALRMTETISKAMRVGGGAAAAQQAALVQLGQAFSAGALRGEELNSVIEGSPRLARAIAEGMGIARGELKKYAEEGKITSEAIANAMRNQRDVIEREFATLPTTVSAEMTRLNNAVMVAMSQLDKSAGISNTIGALVNDLTTKLGDQKFLDQVGAILNRLGTYARIAADAIGFLIDNLDGAMLAFAVFSGTKGALLAISAMNTFSLGTKALTASLALLKVEVGFAQRSVAGLGAMFALTNPISAAISVISAIGIGYLAVADHSDAAGRAVEASNRSIDATRATNADAAKSLEDLAAGYAKADEKARGLEETNLRRAARVAQEAIDAQREMVAESVRKNLSNSPTIGLSMAGADPGTVREFTRALVEFGQSARGTAEPFAAFHEQLRLIAERAGMTEGPLRAVIEAVAEAASASGAHQEKLDKANLSLQVLANVAAGATGPTAGLSAEQLLLAERLGLVGQAATTTASKVADAVAGMSKSLSATGGDLSREIEQAQTQLKTVETGGVRAWENLKREQSAALEAQRRWAAARSDLAKDVRVNIPEQLDDALKSDNMTIRLEAKRLQDQVKTLADTRNQIDARVDKLRQSASKAKTEASQEAKNERLVDALKREFDAREQSERAMAVETAARRLNAKATEEERKEVEKLAGELYDLKAARDQEARLTQARVRQSTIGMTDEARAKVLENTRIASEATKRFGETVKGTAADTAKQEWISKERVISETEASAAAAEKFAQDVKGVADDISGDVAEAMYEGITGKADSILDWFRSLLKRMAVEIIKQQFVLPITTQIVGSMPSLFGIQSPGGSAANQNGQSGGLLSNGNMLSLGSKFLPTGGINAAIDSFGYSALGIGTIGGWAMAAPASVTAATAVPITGAASLNAATGVAAAGNTAAANTLYAGTASGVPGAGVAGGLSAYLGAAGAGALGGMLGGMAGTATNSKAVGGLSGAALGAGASYLGGSLLGIGAMTGPIGLGIAAAVGLITGMLGTQKATVGKTASADVTINAGGKSATYGNVQVDNEGDPEAGRALGTALSGIYSIAAMGGGSLTKNFGIGQTQKDGLYVAGSVDYKKFGDDIAGLLRYTLLDQGGLQGGGANTIAALKASKAKDWEEAAKDIALGASIDAGNTALREFDKSLAGVTKSAKEATTNSLAPLFEELERAKKLGIDGAYVQLASDQLVSYLDTLRNPVAYTETETAVASMKGQFQAMREAAERLNPAIVATVDAIEKETKARIARELNSSLDTQINEQSGRGYINQINGFLTNLDSNARSLLAVGEPVNKAQNLFNASLTTFLNTLSTDQLTDVAKTFGGDIGSLALKIRDASAITQQATRFETLIGQIRQDNINAEISALNEQKSAASSLLSSWKNVQSSIGQARQSLLVGDLSILDPRAKMDTALTAYRDALAKAQGGDVDAAGQVSGLAQTALQAARAYHASNEQYAAIFREVTGGLEGVESVAARQVRLQSDAIGRLDAQLATQQEMLRQLQANPADLAAILRGMTASNAGDIATWATRQDAGTQAAVRRQRLEILGNEDIERLFGGFSDIQAARAVDPGFNLAAWFRSYGINEVMAGTRSIPGFAVGTDSAPPGMAWVGEQGRELVQMAGGERVYPHSVSMDIARSWGPANDRWSGVTEFRRPAASGGGNAALIQRMERQIALLEEQNQLLRQGNSTAGMVGDRVVSRLDGVKDEVRGSAARAEFSKKKVA